MSTGDFSFSFATPTKSSGPAPRYIARPFQARPAGQETLILAAGSETSVRAPLFYAQMLAHCDRLRTIEDHSASVMRHFGLPPDQHPAVQQGLSGLVERALLQDEQNVYETLGRESEVGEPARSALQTLCVRTCDRPDDLSRLLTSLTRYIDATALACVLILDDSRTLEAIAANARAVAEAALRDISLIHIDRARRARLVARISAEVGIDPANLHWLIEGDADDCAASYGTGLNLALLLSAGQRFLMIDDDALLEPHGFGPRQDRLSLRVDHAFGVRFPDPTIAETAQFPALDINPIQAHEVLLGQSVGRIARAWGLQDGHLLEEISPQMIHDFSARPRVRLTTNGTLGDSGTAGMLWQYSLPARTLEPWLDGPETYRHLAFGRRVARSTCETQIGSSVALMTTTLTGIDNRELLLPVPAKGRGEDLVFGAGIRYLYPGSPCAVLPWMLPHRMQSRRRWAAEDLARRQDVGLATYVAERIEDLAETAGAADTGARVDLLAAFMSSLGRMDDHERLADLRHHLLERRAHTADAVSLTLTELNPPDWLRKDFQTVLSGHQHIDAADTRHMAAQAPAIGRFARCYARSLPPWAKAWRYLADNGCADLLAETA